MQGKTPWAYGLLTTVASPGSGPRIGVDARSIRIKTRVHQKPEIDLSRVETPLEFNPNGRPGGRRCRPARLSGRLRPAVGGGSSAQLRGHAASQANSREQAGSEQEEAEKEAQEEAGAA
jgi:hypothetical protein